MTVTPTGRLHPECQYGCPILSLRWPTTTLPETGMRPLQLFYSIQKSFIHFPQPHAMLPRCFRAYHSASSTALQLQRPLLITCDRIHSCVSCVRVRQSATRLCPGHTRSFAVCARVPGCADARDCNKVFCSLPLVWLESISAPSLVTLFFLASPPSSLLPQGKSDLSPTYPLLNHHKMSAISLRSPTPGSLLLPQPFLSFAPLPPTSPYIPRATAHFREHTLLIDHISSSHVPNRSFT